MQGGKVDDPDSSGMIPRAFQYIFCHLSPEHLYTIKCIFGRFSDAVGSYVEIYNEMIFDLLSEGGNRQLQLREDGKRGIIFAENAIEEVLTDPQEALKVYWRGCCNRTVASTMLNRESSRSHAVFTLFITRETKSSINKVRSSRFNLVDLAGSERQSAAQTAGLRLKEAGNINRSLLALANVINALALADSRHAPYRDSKLTFLLRDSLGGNSKTAVIATVSPAASCQGETLSTLRFAQRAKLVKNAPTLNNQLVEGSSVAELQAEVLRLRDLLALAASNVDGSASEYDFSALLFALNQLKKANECIKSLEGRLHDSTVNLADARILELESRLADQKGLQLYAQALSDRLLDSSQLSDNYYDVPMQAIPEQASEESYAQEIDTLKLQEMEAQLASSKKQCSHLEIELTLRAQEHQAVVQDLDAKLEILEAQLEMEQKGAEKLAAQNAYLQSERLIKDMDDQHAIAQSEQISRLEHMVKALSHDLEKEKQKPVSPVPMVITIDRQKETLDKVEELKADLDRRKSEYATQLNERLDEIHGLERKLLSARGELAKLHTEVDKLFEHKDNSALKMNYFQKLKQENTQLRLELAKVQSAAKQRPQRVSLATTSPL